MWMLTQGTRGGAGRPVWSDGLSDWGGSGGVSRTCSQLGILKQVRHGPCPRGRRTGLCVCVCVHSHTCKEERERMLEAGQSLRLRERRITHYSELALKWPSRLEMRPRGPRSHGRLPGAPQAQPRLPSPLQPSPARISHTPSLSSLSMPQPVIQQDKLLDSCRLGLGRQAGAM